MKLKALFIISVCLECLWSLSAFAQAPDSLWTRYFDNDDGEDYCFSIAETSDQGLICAGWSSVEDTLDRAVLIKTGVNGQPIWSRTYGRHHQITGVVQNPDGSYIVGGQVTTGSSGDFWMMKVSSSGDSLWSRTFGGGNWDTPYGIVRTADGGYALFGNTNSFGAGEQDMWLIKTDANGGGLWSQTYGSDGYENGYRIAPMSDGGFILCGSTDSLAAWGEQDAWLVRTDAFGDTLWTGAFGGQFGDMVFSAEQTMDGGVIAGGATTPFDGAEPDFFVVKTDANGNGMWTRTFGGDGEDQCLQVRVLADGGYILSGATQSSGTDYYQPWIIRLNADGDSLWSRVLRSDTNDVSYCGTLTSDGGYVLGCLRQRAPVWDYDMAITKLAPIPLGVDDQFILQPSSFTLSAYPNPFNPSTAIQFSLSRDDAVKLRVYDVNGRLVQTLLERTMPAGEHRVMFEAGNLPSGMYIARLENSAMSKSQKLMLVK